MNSNQCRILFVEDNGAFRQRIIRKYLSRCQVTELAGAVRFTEVINSQKFHCILMDYELPGGQGDELIIRARSDGFRGAIVGISSSEYFNRQLLRAGADSTVEKQQSYLIPHMIRQALSIAEARIGHPECLYER